MVMNWASWNTPLGNSHQVFCAYKAGSQLFSVILRAFQNLTVTHSYFYFIPELFSPEMYSMLTHLHAFNQAAAHPLVFSG